MLTSHTDAQSLARPSTRQASGEFNKTNRKQRGIAAVVACVLSVVLISGFFLLSSDPAQAAVGTKYGEYTVTHVLATGAQTINVSGRVYEVTGGSGTITIASGTTTVLILNGTTRSQAYSPIEVLGTAKVTLYLVSGKTNTFEATSLSQFLPMNSAGIYVEKGATLTIKGPGALIATGAPIGGAGIGGRRAAVQETSGKIIIESGTITATGSGGGGGGGAGIGGGSSPSNGFSLSGDIYIKGGTIRADSNGSSAAIGGGFNSPAVGVIDISGGVIHAEPHAAGAGIGGGGGSVCYKINISGGDIFAKGSNQAAGIGNGKDVTGCTINISGGVIATENMFPGASGVGGGGSGRATINIDGGSVYSINSDKMIRVNKNPTNGEDHGFKPVFLDMVLVKSKATGNVIKNFELSIKVEGPDLTTYIYKAKTNSQGLVYIWLPEGSFYTLLYDPYSGKYQEIQLDITNPGSDVYNPATNTNTIFVDSIYPTWDFGITTDQSIWETNLNLNILHDNPGEPVHIAKKIAGVRWFHEPISGQPDNTRENFIAGYDKATERGASVADGKNGADGKPSAGDAGDFLLLPLQGQDTDDANEKHYSMEISSPGRYWIEIHYISAQLGWDVYHVTYLDVPAIPHADRYLVAKSSAPDTILSSHYWLADAASHCGIDETYIIYATVDDTDMASKEPYLPEPINNSYKGKPVEIPIGKTIMLKSYGEAQYTITQLSEARQLSVKGTLTLKNVILDGNGSGGGVSVAGSLIMAKGATIRNSAGIGFGGGLSITGAVTMNSGSIIYGSIANNSDSQVGYGGGAFLDGGSLIMNPGSTISGNTANTGKFDGAGGGVYIYGGSLTMYTGSEVSGNYASSGNVIAGHYATGGGVQVSVSSSKVGTFNLEGGTVRDNYAGYNSSGSGGGVYVYGSSTYKATLNMTSGTINNNIASRTSYGPSGGVHVGSNAKFNMSGGLITENKVAINDAGSTGNGGGVYVTDGGVFDMFNTAEISHNIGSINGLGNGGGVYVDKAGSSFTMRGNAVISYNSSTLGDGKIGNGGGVYVDNGSSFTMSGHAVISHNSGATGNGNGSNGNGGGVFVLGTNSAFTMSESATISDNFASSYGNGYGGGVYVSNNTKFNAHDTARIINNTALHGDGGGIFSENHDYGKSTVDISRYAPIVKIDSTVVFSSNRASKTYPHPDNYAQVIRFDGQLLNNDDINYQHKAGPLIFTITYMANNGTNTLHTDTADNSNHVTVKTQSELKAAGFTGPVDLPRFLGWNTRADGNGDNIDESEIRLLDSNVVCYAIWGPRLTFNVTISKEVTGVYGDRTKAFDFKVLLYDDDIATTPVEDNTQFVTVDEQGVSGQLTVEDGALTFDLKHHQSITIQGIPFGYWIDVQETNVSKNVYDVTCVDSFYQDIEISHPGKVAGFAQPQQIFGEETFYFTNHRALVEVTGVTLDDSMSVYMMPVALFLLAITLAARPGMRLRMRYVKREV